jgi:dTDP-4-amino-4,6-dideoxygalactose transaminase
MDHTVNPSRAPIMVTRATLPPMDEYVGYLRQIWESHALTNNGPLVRELEQRLREYLESPQLWFVNNGTTALLLAIKALNLQGEIITTPFSYVATTGVILWENLTPVFVDVRPTDLTIDPEQIEAAITPRTAAILATHVYGFPCDVGAIEVIARRHSLKVIYDAAHTFGCRLNGRHLASYGDVSCLSFHATKIFHTVEGGAVVVNGDRDLTERIRLMRSFGHHGDDYRCIGINGKNSEFHAAMGLCNLPRTHAIIDQRKIQYANYEHLLAERGFFVPRPDWRNLEYNYAYFPVMLRDEGCIEKSLSILGKLGIFPRRYFYPSLNLLPYHKGSRCPVSERATQTVLCLPMSDQMTPAVQELVVQHLQVEA